MQHRAHGPIPHRHDPRSVARRRAPGRVPVGQGAVTRPTLAIPLAPQAAGPVPEPVTRVAAVGRLAVEVAPIELAAPAVRITTASENREQPGKRATRIARTSARSARVTTRVTARIARRTTVGFAHGAADPAAEETASRANGVATGPRIANGDGALERGEDGTQLTAAGAGCQRARDKAYQERLFHFRDQPPSQSPKGGRADQRRTGRPQTPWGRSQTRLSARVIGRKFGRIEKIVRIARAGRDRPFVSDSPNRRLLRRTSATPTRRVYESRRFMRCSRASKRGSERRSSNAGSTLSQSISRFRSSQARWSHSNARSFSRRPR